MNYFKNFFIKNVQKACLHPTAWDESFEVLSCILDIERGCCGMDTRLRNDHHDVRVGCEGIDEGTESRVAHFHPLEL